ncbi:hypothetical protein CCR82_02320 [Halochromatium salexigens]|uniref:Periplasmic copper-binding protein NosD beta helix domain-containing protein n=1 Tax=Halochromatium salexigens TaxID=49447 RepID=A0AAJ0XEM7_HALSE|nr:hypothetical protein [Halochromatium salexigens]
MTLYLDSTLYINEQVIIDATTQPGFVTDLPDGRGFPAIILDAQGLASAIHLQSGDSSTVAGLSIINYSSNAVTIGAGSAANWVRDNFLGLATYNQGGYYELNYAPPYQRAGTRGIGIASSRNVLLRNVISGNDNAITIGDDISTTDSTDVRYQTNSLQFNYVGTDATGTKALGNTSDGLFLGAGAGETWIGPGNVFSGNNSAGIELLHPSNIGNVIFDNHIGVDRDGTAVLANGEIGILISNGAYYNAIGGSWGGNVISGNSLGGVVIGLYAPSPGDSGHADLNYIQNNIIGADKTATVPLGMQDVGLSIEGGSTNVVVEGNVLGGNITHGVQCYDSQNNSISYNSIGQNESGLALPNQNGFGIFLSNCSNVWTIDNRFGSNGLGTIGQQ